jgi:4-deoxy-L-threo-5-hexosulose-uronate ketol-isomerase
MLTVETRHAIHPEHARGMGTEELRRHFLAQNLFRDGEIRLVYTHYDRFVLGGAVPAGGPLTLDEVAETRTPNFLDRREMGIVNIGDTGAVTAAGQTYTLERGDVLYLGMGSGPVDFAGNGRLYITSAPAHRTCPSRLIRRAEARHVEIGAAETCNKRTINQFIHPLVMDSCQLVLGYTSFAPGSVWNTMPAHVHDRRMEAYLYFDMDPASRVLHLMGEPT